jgi:hypothetical protein
MSDIALLILRHLLALCGGFFAANNIAGDSTTSIILGLGLIAIPVALSTITKWLHLDAKLATDITGNQMLRTALGALVSQGITALSAYFAVDANQPELLLGAVVNAGLSKAGVHQAVAFAGAKPVLKVLALFAASLSLMSCATTAAFLASPFGQATLQTADQLGKQVILATERAGLQQIILQASAKVSALKASGIDPDPVKETLRIAEIGGFTGVVEAAQVKYEQLTGARYALPKNPTLPVVAR